MKSKIKEALKTKHSGLGVSDAVLDGLAEFLSQTVKEESQIAGVVENSGGLLTSFQTETNRRVGKLVDDNKQLKTSNDELSELKDQSQPQTAPSGGEDDEKEPAWAKAIREQNEKILGDKADADKALTDKNLRSSAKKIAMLKKLDEELCDDILANTSISEGDTAEIISGKVIEKYDFLQTKLTPKAGPPHAGGGAGTENDLKGYLAEKAKESENASKLNENAEIK